MTWRKQWFPDTTGWAYEHWDIVTACITSAQIQARQNPSMEAGRRKELLFILQVGICGVISPSSENPKRQPIQRATFIIEASLWARKEKLSGKEISHKGTEVSVLLPFLFPLFLLSFSSSSILLSLLHLLLPSSPILLFLFPFLFFLPPSSSDPLSCKVPLFYL